MKRWNSVRSKTVRRYGKKEKRKHVRLGMIRGRYQKWKKRKRGTQQHPAQHKLEDIAIQRSQSQEELAQEHHIWSQYIQPLPQDMDKDSTAESHATTWWHHGLEPSKGRPGAPTAQEMSGGRRCSLCGPTPEVEKFTRIRHAWGSARIFYCGIHRPPVARPMKDDDGRKVA